MTLFNDCFGDLSEKEQDRIARIITCMNRIIMRLPRQTYGEVRGFERENPFR